MRIVKYRAKRSDTGEWIIGDLLTSNGTECEISDWNDIAYSRYDVLSNTVGQFTGVLDTYGKEVYEGDIIKITMKDKMFYAIIQYNESSLTFVAKTNDRAFNGCSFSYLAPLVTLEITFAIVGNIHDNPELINF